VPYSGIPALTLHDVNMLQLVYASSNAGKVVTYRVRAAQLAV